FEEYRLFQRHGCRADLADYERRYPFQFEELKQLIGVAPSVRAGPATILASTATAHQPTPAAPASPKAPEIGHGYEPIKFLGRGGFAEVWLAKAPGGIDVAVKILNRLINVEQAQRELQAL